MLIKLKDGNVEEIYSDSDFEEGCPTCNYGSQYINKFTVRVTQGDINFEVNDMYNFALSDEYVMKLFLKNIDDIKKLTENELYYWLENKLKNDFKNSVESESFDFHKTW